MPHNKPQRYRPLGLIGERVPGSLMTVQRQTIVHNVSDEPITVEQRDGSHVVVPARAKRPAELPSEADYFVRTVAQQDRPAPISGLA